MPLQNIDIFDKKFESTMKTGEGSSLKKRKTKNGPIKKSKKKGLVIDLLEIENPYEDNYTVETPIKSNDSFSPSNVVDEKKLEKSVNFKNEMITQKLNHRL
jgi:hypothetical protein